MTDMQYVEVPIGALDTSVDPAVAPPGTLTIADNASADTPGIYEKRRGYAALAAIPTTPLVRLSARKNELLALTRSLLYCYEGPTVDGWRSPLQQTSGSITSSRLPSAQVSQASVYLDQTLDITVGSRATSATTSVTVHAHPSTSIIGIPTLNIRCIDASGCLVAMTIVASGNAPAIIHCVAAGQYVLVLATSSAGSLYYVRVDTAALTFGATTIYQTVSATVPFFDATAVSATSCLIAWNSNTPNVRVALFNIATLTTTAGPTVQSADVLDGGLSIAQDGGTFGMVAWHSVAGGGVRGACFNATTTVNTVANFTIDATTAPLSPNTGLVYSTVAAKMYCVWDRAANGTTKQFIKAALITSAGAVTAMAGQINGLALASKPAVDPTAADAFFPILLNVWMPQSLQQTYFTIRTHVTSAAGLPVFSPMAMHAYRGAYKSAIVTGQLTDVDVYSATAIAFSASIAYKFLSTNIARAGWSTFTVDLGSATMLGHVQALGSTYVAGGHGATYDGVTIREMNFLGYPDITSATPGAVGAAGMDDGTYSYIAVFEASDAQGNTDRSTTSLAVAATTSAGAGLGKVTLTIDGPPTRIGQVSTAVPAGNISLFRTTSGGTTYFCILTGALTSGPTSTFVDQANDSTITSNRVLYTAGGVLDREPPPTAMQFLIHRNRLWGISAADRKVLFYSGELSPGESPWFSGVQQLRVDSGGDITAIATMDDKLIVYKSDRVFKVYGSGANALGQNSDLSAPTPMNTDAGALDARATVAMHAGTMYRNKKGIQLFSRGEESGYIGAPVESYLDATGSVIASTLLTTAREVRFELDTGKKAVYNYGTQRWTTHSNYLGASAVDAICVGDTYYWATSTGVVYKESTSSYLDPASTFAPMTIEFAWIAPAGRQGLVRARRVIALADRRDPHDLTVTSSVNYGTFEAPIVSALTNAVIAAWPREQVRVTLLSQKVESIKVKLVDAVSSGGGATVTGQGYALRGLAFLAGVMKGAFDKQFVAAARV